MRGKPHDLARERRIGMALGRLRGLLANDPALAERTRALLAGKIVETDHHGESMSPVSEAQVSIRLPAELLERADKIAVKLASDTATGGTYRVTRASALRLAMIRGIEALEAELLGEGKQRKR